MQGFRLSQFEKTEKNLFQESYFRSDRAIWMVTLGVKYENSTWSL